MCLIEDGRMDLIDWIRSVSHQQLQIMVVPHTALVFNDCSRRPLGRHERS